MSETKIGRVTHYYDKIGVAVLELSSELKVGDKIKFVRGGEDLFEQEVGSIQMEHQTVDRAKKGADIGLKVDEEVKDGAEVFKIT